jgi:hypothetical protein
MKEYRHEMSKVVQSLNRKASKSKLEEHAKNMQEAISKRLDSIRNWAALAIAAAGAGVALVNVLRK